jgi:4'-phosphopantetheinyl transferase
VTPVSGECHLWLVPVRHRPGWADLLDQEERERAGRLSGTPAENTFVTSRAAQRLVGARYLGVPPADVRITRECAHCAGSARHGRPRFRGEPAGRLEYSVSHTEDWLIIAVTAGGPVGVDIEELTPVLDPGCLARTILTPGELARFETLPEAERSGWLLSAWTRKEAAMKLTGLGLQAPPSLLDVSGTTVVAALPRWPAGTIHLSSPNAPEGHVSALATTVPPTALRHFRLPEPLTALAGTSAPEAVPGGARSRAA